MSIDSQFISRVLLGDILLVCKPGMRIILCQAVRIR